MAETRSEIAFDLIALYKALGGGWEIGDIKPIVPEAMQAQMMNRTDWGNLLPAPKAPPAEALPLPTPAGQMLPVAPLPPDFEAAPMPPGRPANP